MAEEFHGWCPSSSYHTQLSNISFGEPPSLRCSYLNIIVALHEPWAWVHLVRGQGREDATLGGQDVAKITTIRENNYILRPVDAKSLREHAQSHRAQKVRVLCRLSLLQDAWSPRCGSLSMIAFHLFG